MPITDPTLATAQATVGLHDHTDWSARRVATHIRVLENALSKIRKEVELASYSGKDISNVSLKQLLIASEPASKWEWDPKTSQELMNKVLIRRVHAQPTRRQGYADASRKKGISLRPRRLSPSDEGSKTSIFKNYLQNPYLRRNLLIAGVNQSVRSHYTTVLSQCASIVQRPTSENNDDIPSLYVLSARAFGRAIVQARDPEDPQGDYSWYSYCDENSNMYHLLAETLRGQITQLLCNALQESWFPADLASTLISQTVHAGDSSLTELLFQASYRSSWDNNRSVARRKGELAPDPFSHILYMPDLLFRQIHYAIDERPSTMLDAWFRDVMFLGIGEMGMHMELTSLTIKCLEMLLGIEVWEEGVHRKRLNRSGKAMRKKYESFDKAWLFQSKDVIQSKASNVAQDLIERLYEVGWGDIEVGQETQEAAREVIYVLVNHMVQWAHAFNHPHKEASEGSSITARTLALCAVLQSERCPENLSIKDVMAELVRLLLITMIEASEEEKISTTEDYIPGAFDLTDLAKYIAEVVNRVHSSPSHHQGFIESLLNLAIGTTGTDFTQTPAVGDKQKMRQKRQNYIIAIFAYHLAESLAESSKSAVSHSFALQVGQRLVGLQISKKGLLKASDLRTPKFSNLMKDVAQSEFNHSRWVYEPMLNEWIEVLDDGNDMTVRLSETTKNIKKISRRLNFNQTASSIKRNDVDEALTRSDGMMTAEITTLTTAVEQETGSLEQLSLDVEDSDASEQGDYHEDSTLYPASNDTTMVETSLLLSPQRPLNHLVEVCIQDNALSATAAASRHLDASVKIATEFRESKDMLISSDITNRGKQPHKINSSVAPEKLGNQKNVGTMGRSPFGENDKVKASFTRRVGSSDEGENSRALDVPKKRGRPMKRKYTGRPKATVTGLVESTDSAYEPDSDDNKINCLRADKARQPSKHQRGLQKVERQKRKRDSHCREGEPRLDIYRDELDLVTNKREKSNLSSNSGVFRDAGSSKLNIKESGRNSGTSDTEVRKRRRVSK